MDQNDYQKFDDGTKRFVIDGFADAFFEDYREDGIVICSSSGWCSDGYEVNGRWLLSQNAELTNLPFEEEVEELDYLDNDAKLPPHVKEISFDGVDYGPIDDPRELYSNWSEFPDLAKPDVWKYFRPNNYGSMRHAWWQNYRVTQWNSLVYIVSEILETEDNKDEERIITALYDPGADLQLGDSCTGAYLLNNKHVIIEHRGDVSSVVTIKMN